jgi:RNA polymerase sigma-70 factor (ECF subfamily)
LLQVSGWDYAFSDRLAALRTYWGDVTLSMRIGACPPADVADVNAPERAVKSGVVHAPAVPAPLSPARRDAFLAELLRLHYGTVWRTLRRVGVTEDRVDDAAQEVFIIASRKLDQIQPGCERSYLLNSAIRVAANFRRAVRTRREVADEGVLEEQRDPAPSADQLLHRKRLREVLDQVLEGWPAELRTAFVLFELEGLSVPEIAELTETKSGTVASRLRRGRELFLAAVKRLKARGLVEGAGT